MGKPERAKERARMSQLLKGSFQVFDNRAAGERAGWTIARRVRLWRGRINGVRGSGRHGREAPEGEQLGRCGSISAAKVVGDFGELGKGPHGGGAADYMLTAILRFLKNA